MPTVAELTRTDEQPAQEVLPFITCDHCSQNHIEEYIITNDGKHFCSTHCAIHEGYRRCDGCNEWFNLFNEEAIFTDTHQYCSERCALSHGLTEIHCDACGSRCHEDVMITIDNDTTFCSLSCAHANDYYACDDCRCFVHYDDMNETYNGEHVCDECYDNHYFTCRECENIFHLDDCYEDEDGFLYCSSCFHELHRYVHPYGYTPTLAFFGSSDEHPYLGIELEIDDGNRDSCAEDIDKKFEDRIYMTHDSSLSEYAGIELTSHPMTTEEHLGGWWKDVFDIAIYHGFTSHDNGNCGLHIHIDKGFFGRHSTFRYLAGQKLATIVDRFQTQLRAFSRRESDYWCNYCSDLSYLTRFDNRPMVNKAKCIIDEHSGHSRAVNFQHSQTFEIRIFRGTLKLETFYAAIMLTDALARAVKNHSTTWCETVSWYEFIEWALETCDIEEGRLAFANYLYSKGLVEDSVFALYDKHEDTITEKEEELCVLS